MEYCPHCLKETEGTYCTHCGGLVNWEASQGQLPVGTILLGTKGLSYQIGAAKGQGGFGITYAAMSLENGQRVAIKEYYPSRCANRDFGNRVVPLTGHDDEYQKGIKDFLEEAMMLSAVGVLSSVVTVIEYFEANETAYLVMEYVDGSPLHSVVSQNGHFMANELMPKFSALLDDLGVLHKSGIIHRDISPDNLILTPEGKLKLIDFGSARNMNSSKNMTVLLKPGFSPVEQYQSSGQGPYTDLYALASTMYYCLTGVIPPTSFDRLSNDTLQRPNTLGADMTPEQENALIWALSVKAEDRPQSAESFAERLFRSESLPLPPVSATKKRKLLIIAAIMSVSFVINVLLFALLLNETDSKNYYRREYRYADIQYDTLENKYNSLLNEKNSFDTKYKALENKYSELQSDYEILENEQNESDTKYTELENRYNLILENETLYDSVVITEYYMWYFNEVSNSTATKTNFELIKAAALWSEDLGNGYTDTRADGSDIFTLLKECDISYNYAVRNHMVFEYSDFLDSGEDEIYDFIEDTVEYAHEREHKANNMGIGVNIKNEQVSVTIFMIEE